MSERVRLLAERFPVRFKPERARLVHAGRIIRWGNWSDLRLVEAACGNINPPHPDEAGITNAEITCPACAKRIARPMTLSQILVADKARV